MPLREPLGVWLHGIRVAELITRGPGAVQCQYTTDARERCPDGAPLLSCSLPISARLQDATVFCAGLLPEGEQRRLVAATLGVPAGDVFTLLEHLGRDLPGAMIISRDDPAADPGDVEEYTEESLAADVAALAEQPLGFRPDSALSLAGRRDKLPLVELENGRWGRPLRGYPTTHILKAEDPRFPGQAAAEAACHRIARGLALTTVDAEVVTLGGRPCVFFPRFDRMRDEAGRIGRVHLEDACQALGKDPDAARGRGHYESSGGPSLRALAGLIASFSDDAETELMRLVAATTFSVVIGNAEAHGRNLALWHTAPGVVSLAPLYATVPTQLWPTLRAETAMSIGGRSALRSLTLDDIEAEAASWNIGRRRARREAERTVEGALELAQGIEPRLGGMIVARAGALLSGGPAGGSSAAPPVTGPLRI
jgi:serine/threonine-protein kinase HipA